MKKQEIGSYYLVEMIPVDVKITAFSPLPGPGEIWYCHRKGFPYCPVFGSIGTKKQAEAVCRTYNKDGRVRYT